MQNYILSMICFWSAHILVALCIILHNIFNIKVLHKEFSNVLFRLSERYDNNLKFQPIYHIILYSVAGFFYVNTLGEL